jgi:hypothetical protein
MALEVCNARSTWLHRGQLVAAGEGPGTASAHLRNSPEAQTLDSHLNDVDRAIALAPQRGFFA